MISWPTCTNSRSRSRKAASSLEHWKHIHVCYSLLGQTLKSQYAQEAMETNLTQQYTYLKWNELHFPMRKYFSATITWHSHLYSTKSNQTTSRDIQAHAMASNKGKGFRKKRRRKKRTQKIASGRNILCSFTCVCGEVQWDCEYYIHKVGVSKWKVKTKLWKKRGHQRWQVAEILRAVSFAFVDRFCEGKNTTWGRSPQMKRKKTKTL